MSSDSRPVTLFCESCILHQLLITLSFRHHVSFVTTVSLTAHSCLLDETAPPRLAQWHERGCEGAEQLPSSAGASQRAFGSSSAGMALLTGKDKVTTLSLVSRWTRMVSIVRPLNSTSRSAKILYQPPKSRDQHFRGILTRLIVIDHQAGHALPRIPSTKSA